MKFKIGDLVKINSSLSIHKVVAHTTFKGRPALLLDSGWTIVETALELVHRKTKSNPEWIEEWEKSAK